MTDHDDSINVTTGDAFTVNRVDSLVRHGANGDAVVVPEDRDVLIGLSPLLAGDSPLSESCGYIVSTPGKRFRGAIVEAASYYGKGRDAGLVERSAVAIELFHAATLAHDDVVDDGQLRRGKATIGAHSGSLAASLAGGWLFARSVELIAEAGEEATVKFAKATSVVCEGEMRESCDLHDVDRTRERYFAVIEAKTAKLIAFASWLGGTVGGATPEVTDALETYGTAVGMAFQIADDILDLVADPVSTGKTPGVDLRQGVYALPTIYALESDLVLRDRLVRGCDEKELPELIDRIRAAGAIERAMEDCKGWIARAEEALPQHPVVDHELLLLARTVWTRVEEMTLL